MKYCPSCGRKRLKLKKEKIIVCENCGFIYYHNIAAAVGGIIDIKQKGILITIRKDDPGKKMFDLPGGFLDLNETGEQAIIREIKEELNIKIIKTKYFVSEPNIYSYKNIKYRTLDLFYICEPENLKNLTPRDDVLDYRFIKKKNLKIEKFAFSSTKKAVQKYIKLYE